MKFKATLESEQLRFFAPTKLTAFLSKYKKGDLFDVEIKKWRKKRSLSQNNYYWGVVIDLIALDTGEDPQLIDRYLEEKFAPREKVRELEIPKHCKNMDTKEFADYTEKIRDWASAELGNFIPSPDEYLNEINNG